MSALCQFSGGYDSVAACIKMLEAMRAADGVPVTLRGRNPWVDCVFFNYGQPYAAHEWNAAQCIYHTLRKHEIQQYLGALHRVDFQLRIAAPEGSSGKADEYIPVRNLVLAAASVNMAIAQGHTELVVGTKTDEYREDDPYCFRDCTREFFDSLQATIDLCIEKKTPRVKILRPVAGMSKKQVIEICAKYNVDSLTWTCYSPTPEGNQCGKCFHCMEAIHG